MTLIYIINPIIKLFYPSWENYAFSFIPGIRDRHDADILLDHTEKPQLNVEAVAHAEKSIEVHSLMTFCCVWCIICIMTTYFYYTLYVIFLHYVSYSHYIHHLAYVYYIHYILYVHLISKFQSCHVSWPNPPVLQEKKSTRQWSKVVETHSEDESTGASESPQQSICKHYLFCLPLSCASL